MNDQLLFADRSERGKLRVTGEQRAWFLDQILTQSFEDMKPGDARESALLTVHGRMQAYLEVLATDDSFLCHYEPELREFVPEALQRYVFATRVTLEDVGEAQSLLLLVGDEWSAAAADIGADASAHPTQSLGLNAGYVWITSNEKESALERLASKGAVPANEEMLESIRISHGVPRWGRDMDTKTFPQEAGVDVRAVHYEKGCYLGQEAMAKIHFRGKVNRRLARLEGAGPIPSGAEVWAGEEKVGTVTSAADGRGLALVRYTTEAGTTVRAGDVEARVVS
jgi:tRNA-modifying protein YgfZ